MAGNSNRGFAAMDADKQRKIASKGGKSRSNSNRRGSKSGSSSGQGQGGSNNNS
jgi:hypothetical protein